MVSLPWDKSKNAEGGRQSLSTISTETQINAMMKISSLFHRTFRLLHIVLANEDDSFMLSPHAGPEPTLEST